MSLHGAWIAGENLADAAAIAADDEVATLPASNLHLPSPGEVWRATESPVELTLTWPAEQSANLFAWSQWREGRMLAEGDTVELLLDDVSQGGAQPHGVIEGLGYHVRLLEAPVQFTTLTWRITFAASYVQLGRVWVAPARRPDRGHEWGAHPWRWVNGDAVARNARSGRAEGDPGSRWRRQQLSFPLATAADVAAFSAIDRLCGTARQVAVISHGERAAETCLFGRLSETTDFDPLHVGITSKSLQIEEDN